MSENGAMIHARGLVKRFGELVAVDGIDLDVKQGEAFGFLGPNGAGKSSTMRMIGCVSPVTGGTLRILGKDPATEGAQIRARLGVVPQQDTLDFELTVRENVLIYGRYFGLSRRELKPRIDELLDFVQLTERAGDKVEPLSGGMKRRLTIARSLVNDPDLLLLDEPTTGLDPQARHVVWDRLFRLKQQGKTFVVTTHYMDEAEQLCDRLVVMDHGAIVAEGSPWELIQRYSTREVVEIRFEDERPAERRLRGRRGARRGAAGPRPALHARRRRDRDGRRRPRAAAAFDARPAEHAGGRLPAPHRTHAGRLAMDSVLQPLRAYEHWLAQYRRVWRGTIGTSLVNPILYVTALGVGLGTIVDQTQNTPGGVPYLDYVAPGPARRRRDADRHDRVELAGDGRDQVVARLPRDDRDAADRARRVRRPPAVRDHTGLHVRGRLSRRDRCLRRRLPPGGASSSSRSPC